MKIPLTRSVEFLEILDTELRSSTIFFYSPSSYFSVSFPLSSFATDDQFSSRLPTVISSTSCTLFGVRSRLDERLEHPTSPRTMKGTKLTSNFLMEFRLFLRKSEPWGTGQAVGSSFTRGLNLLKRLVVSRRKEGPTCLMRSSKRAGRVGKLIVVYDYCLLGIGAIGHATICLVTLPYFYRITR